MVSKVQITDPDGYKNYLPGDIVDYNVVADTYEPRQGSITQAVDKSTNMYL